MRRTSNCQQYHTESNRLMRGAWGVDSEYIFELRAKRFGQENGTGPDGK